MYNFEEFKSTGSRSNYIISLGKHERFYLGNAFYTKYNLASMSGVILMYDREKKAVGFRFVKGSEVGMIGMKKLTDSSAYINAKGFLNTYNINSEKFLGRYIPVETTVGEKQVFVIHLEEKTELHS